MARRKQYVIADPSAVITDSPAQPTIIADGNYPASPGYINYEGGNGSFFVVGTFGGGTAKLQIQAPDGSTWLDVGAGTTLTTSGIGGFTLPTGRLRLSLSGSAAPSIKSWVVGIPTNNGG